MLRSIITTTVYLLFAFSCWIPSSRLGAQQDESTINKTLKFSPQEVRPDRALFHLFPTEEEQEHGNAVPVLLRMVYEQQQFMKDVYPKLQEYAEMDLSDSKLHELHFQRFAEQIERAGSMSHADWEYPLRSSRPYMILLPDLQSQRQLVGRGMTAWIKQRLSKGETDEALKGIKAQLGCSRHCAATPVVICHLVGLAIANTAFDNLELAIQTGECPNMYQSLAVLSPTLQDLGPMVRWELWAAPTRLNEPLPSIGNEEWQSIARRFVDLFSEASTHRYTKEEGAKLQKNMERLATDELSNTLGFTKTEIEQMTTEERVMRWLYAQDCRFRSGVEPLAYKSPRAIIEAKKVIEADHKKLLDATGAKSSAFPVSMPQALIACHAYDRRIKFLQTIESIRDFTSKHQGKLPAALADLEWAAPNDPFTEAPFLYEVNGQTARLKQAEISGLTTKHYDYELIVQ